MWQVLAACSEYSLNLYYTYITFPKPRFRTLFVVRIRCAIAWDEYHVRPYVLVSLADDLKMSIILEK